MNYLKEQQVWDYLDGHLDPQEQETVAALIKTDPEYAALYRELSLLNSSLAVMETEAPSMSFTRKVMDQLHTEPVPGSIASLIDKKIIYGLAAFFILSITALLVFALAGIDWAQPSGSESLKMDLPKIGFSFATSPVYLKGFLLADIVIGLYLLDNLLRKKHPLQVK